MEILLRVRALRSAEAAKEIKGLIEQSAASIELGSNQVTEAGRAMQQIVTSVNNVMSTMQEISTATSEQSVGIEQVSLAVVQMDKYFVLFLMNSSIWKSRLVH